MRIGYECMLTGPRQTGVGFAVSELLRALSQASPLDEFIAFTSPAGASALPRNPNVQHVLSSLAETGRACRVLWQQMCAHRWAAKYGVQIYHAPGYVGPVRTPIPVVVTAYDITALEQPKLTTRLNAAHYRHVLPRSLRSAQRVIVPSHHVKRRLMEVLEIPEAKIHVIPLGIADGFRRIPEETAWPLVKQCSQVLADRRPFFLCVGNIEKKKNLGLAVRALHLCRQGGDDIRLVLAGRYGNDEARLRRQIRASGLEDTVHWLGYVDQTTLVALYSVATALLFPSLDEGFGFPPLEAMACETPALVSDAGALPETVGGAALLLPSTDPEAWAEFMLRLLHSESLKLELRQKGKARAARFTWQLAAEETLDLYREVLREASW